MMNTDLRPLLDSMESSLKLRCQARAEKRAREAEKEQKEFKEKLMRAAAGKTELDIAASRVKGKSDAVQRDQLTCLMMAGF